MKAWQLNAPKIIEEINKQDLIESVNSSKIKLTKALITENDCLTFIGQSDSVYPLILGRHALGIVVETGANCFGIDKNDRVYIDPITNCGVCYNCLSGNNSSCICTNVAGENIDGYFRDFATVPCNNLFVLPSSIKDEEALFIEHISIAVSIIDKLNITKGVHVAVIGGGILSNILCQLIIYYQGVPILIDNDKNNLELAKKSGIYYTLFADNNLNNAVVEITGGRMTSKTVFMTDSDINTKVPFSLTSFGGKVAFAGLSYKNFKIDFSGAMKKQLTILGITDGYGLTSASINLLANKAINFSNFTFENIAYANIPKTLNDMALKLENKEDISEKIVKLL